MPGPDPFCAGGPPPSQTLQTSARSRTFLPAGVRQRARKVPSPQGLPPRLGSCATEAAPQKPEPSSSHARTPPPPQLPADRVGSCRLYRRHRPRPSTRRRLRAVGGFCPLARRRDARRSILPLNPTRSITSPSLERGARAHSSNRYRRPSVSAAVGAVAPGSAALAASPHTIVRLGRSPLASQYDP